ncbi:MAG: VWA domain-containing protein [Acidobacteriota bacterium]
MPALLAGSAVLLVGAASPGPILRQTQRAQQPQDVQQPQQPVFRAGVSLVRVDVSVRDRRGRPIDDLQADDFEVFEDGVRQTIATLQLVSIDGQPAPGDDTSLEIRSQEHARAEAAREDVRLFAILLDDYHISKLPLGIMLRLRPALLDFVRQFAPTDLVAVLDPLTPLSAVEFTRSRYELEERIRKLEGRKGEYFPIKSALEEFHARQPNVAELRADLSLSTLEAIVTYLGGLREGRKSVLFVSEGPPFTRPGQALDHRVRAVIEAANRANVTIHVLEPREFGPGDIWVREVLFRFASETGGRQISNPEDDRVGLSQVITDASAYYLVGYTPTREFNDGKFHEIEVKVKRSGTQVAARKGYWAPKAEDIEAAARAAAARPDVPGLEEALSGLSGPRSGRPVRLWQGFGPGGDSLTRVTLTWEPEEEGGLRAGTATRLTIEVPSEEPGTEPRLAVTTVSVGKEADGPTAASFVHPPGSATLRLTALGDDGRVIDKWTARVDVPDFSAAPVGLATPRFYRARTFQAFRQLQAAANPTPVAARTFRRTDRVLVDLAGSAKTEEPPALKVELLGSTGQMLSEMPLPEPSGGRVRFELPVGRIAPGTYVLRIQAVAGDQKAELLEAFKIVP